ncbi:MAG: HlyD family efflux transporter periplasmic adaptor subunit [Phaeodactylibacter sp.]|nr:HlyD family efflux transporter periplasmic adaptor subunit [Phaeodactylibacter sp.]
MDRAVSLTIQRRRFWKRLAGWLAGLVLLAAALLAFRHSLSTSIRKAQVRTAVAGRGAVIQTLAATGLVLPEFEEVITAPVTADIQQVLVSEGTVVAAGQPLLVLDQAALEAEAGRLEDELALRRNSIRKLRLELARSLFDLQVRDSIKALGISSLEAALDNARRLKQVGGATQEQVEQAELELRIARLEKRQLENELKTKQQSIEAELRESELEAQIQERRLLEQKSKLAQAVLAARRPGVVTWINKQVGAAAREGEPLSKVAGLGAYRLEGSVSELYASRVQVGMPVQVRINDSLLIGAIINIRPTVENDVLAFDVSLENPSHPMLRPNLRTEIFIVTGSRPDVVRVANGPAFNGQRRQELFILEGDRARRRTIPVGLSNFDFVELEEGVLPGEQVIISDMSDYEHLKELRVRE